MMMKRDPRLIEFSREHHSALKLGFFLKNSNDNTEMNLQIHALKNILLHHFFEEEQELWEILNNFDQSSLKDRFLSDHKNLRQLLNQDTYTYEDAKAIGTLLTDHSRFEERELFPAIQNFWDKEELDHNV